MISIGGLLAIAGTGATVVLALMGLDTPYTLIVPMFIYSWGSGFLVPNSLAGALTAVAPPTAGSAAALGGFIQMSAGFASTLAVASLVQTSFLQLGLLMLGCTTLSWLFFVVMVRRDAA